MSQSSKHTPGPWKVLERNQEEDLPVYASADDSGWLIALVAADGHMDGDPDPQRANARLIATAPELLEALKEVLAREIPNARLQRSVYEKATAAIAKAEPQ